MDIGRPKRIITVEPLQEPVPQEPRPGTEDERSERATPPEPQTVPAGV
ncbi:MAG TPA: hypothetical protein VMG74_04530 [Gaiellaceae bacterium]|nr:hypothetical protein [Gaiellaceae bacterium]